MASPIRTILVVDDDSDLRAYLTNVLTAAGYAVLTAPNGARALDVLEQLPTRCLVITDLSMPVMTGWDFVVELQSLPHSATRFPVIVLTGVQADDAWRLPGVVRTVTKPLRVEELIEAVNEEATAFTTETHAA